MSNVLVECDNLTKHFPVAATILTKQQFIYAVDGVSFKIYRGDVFGLVGESGSGKSTTARLILRLYDPTAGKVYFDGMDVFALNKKELRNYRTRAQMVFQDPNTSLNPRMMVKDIIGEPLVIHNIARGETLERMVMDLLELVGLPRSYVSRFPHELSGGQKQRVGIARALALNPEFVIADEPFSALDVSIRAQIINLMMDLKKELDLTYMIITHDLSIVRYMSNRIAVMYLGKLMEIGTGDEIFNDPRHPYTKALISAVPEPDPDKEWGRIILKGDVPSAANPPPGCRFNTRCFAQFARCRRECPKLHQITETHYVACHLFEKGADEK
ncbi:MAG: ABC transporter ATP-binding protein [Candidatus Korarchaeota archaeon]